MLSYEEEDFKSLLVFLGPHYEEISDLIQEHLDRGTLQDGVREGGSMGAALFMNDLQELFPDIFEALFRIPKEDLPMYLEEAHEGVIARWRLDLGR
jgi:hypothetical protein